MAELYVKPGNKEKGWNDPPQFSYGLQMSGGGKRTPLNKRVPVPLQDPPAASSGQPLSSSTPPKMPPAGSTSNIGPPPLGQVSSPLRTDNSKPCSSQTESQAPVDVKDVLVPLREILEACKDLIKKQVFLDISKRLAMLEEMWNSGKLSSPVQRRMGILVKDLNQNWNSADEVHRSLMVDHVNEVSQWMVGVKRLIAEARNLPHEELPAKEEAVTESTDSGHQDT
ncbi:PREDICTED: steroid receptor RNA activator 1 isoform X1 [Nanorana parkeri]|uniref:steroid receptor RNA activator 1 isoform X1 n=1 Tax=Nanorana parkeri TaxID=125878 RepID=UPI0008549CC5|nr:PREDICTED: steroid receptor RNA activator 1 isoform X1 [Nanorana parkeri]